MSGVCTITFSHLKMHALNPVCLATMQLSKCRKISRKHVSPSQYLCLPPICRRSPSLPRRGLMIIKFTWILVMLELQRFDAPSINIAPNLIYSPSLQMPLHLHVLESVRIAMKHTKNHLLSQNLSNPIIFKVNKTALFCLIILNLSTRLLSSVS